MALPSSNKMKREEKSSATTNWADNIYQYKSVGETDVLRNEEPAVAFLFWSWDQSESHGAVWCNYADVVYVESDRHQRPP